MPSWTPSLARGVDCGSFQEGSQTQPEEAVGPTSNHRSEKLRAQDRPVGPPPHAENPGYHVQDQPSSPLGGISDVRVNRMRQAVDGRLLGTAASLLRQSPSSGTGA